MRLFIMFHCIIGTLNLLIYLKLFFDLECSSTLCFLNDFSLSCLKRRHFKTAENETYFCSFAIFADKAKKGGLILTNFNPTLALLLEGRGKFIWSSIVQDDKNSHKTLSGEISEYARRERSCFCILKYQYFQAKRID